MITSNHHNMLVAWDQLVAFFEVPSVVICVLIVILKE